MKRLTRWAFAGSALLLAAGIGEAQVWSDSFDTYAPNSFLPPQGGWEEWDQATAFTNTKVQNVAAGAAVRSAPNSIWVRASSDTIYDWGQNMPGVHTSGQWTFCGFIYKPTNTTGFTMSIPSYWIMLNEYAHGAGNNNNWSVEVNFNPLTGNWAIATATTTFTGPAVFDTWAEVRAEVDLNADSVEIFYNGTTTGVSYPWNGGVSGFGTGSSAIDTLDLYAAGALNPASRVYWDDLSLKPGFTGCGATACQSNPVTYCTAGTSTSGCTPNLTSSGTASATSGSGFTVTATAMEGLKDGTIFFGQNGQQANPWGNGTSFQCVTPPVKRGGVLPGNGTNGACNQTLSQDLNAHWCPTCPKPNHQPTVGVPMQIQLWYRDPGNTSNQSTSLTDALEVNVCP
jgi:hypothetical protein